MRARWNWTGRVPLRARRRRQELREGAPATHPAPVARGRVSDGHRHARDELDHVGLLRRIRAPLRRVVARCAGEGRRVGSDVVAKAVMHASARTSSAQAAPSAPLPGRRNATPAAIRNVRTAHRRTRRREQDIVGALRSTDGPNMVPRPHIVASWPHCDPPCAELAATLSVLVVTAWINRPCALFSLA